MSAAILVVTQLLVAQMIAALLVAPLALILAGGDYAGLSRGAFVGAASLAANALTLGLLVLLARRWPDWRSALALFPGRLPLWMVAPATLALVVAMDALTALSGRPIVPQQLAPFFSGGFDTLAMALSVVIGAPIVEELVYRGVLYGALERRWGSAAAFVVTAALFGLVHVATYGTDSFALAMVLLLGAYLTWLRWRSGSVLPPLLAHLVANLYATVVIVVLGGSIGGRT